jgi:hypothetical protein
MLSYPPRPGPLDPSSVFPENPVVGALLGTVLFDGVLAFKGTRSSSVTSGSFSKVVKAGNLSAPGAPLTIGAPL